MVNKDMNVMARLFLVVVSILFLIGFSSAATFTNVVSICAAEDNAVKGSFGGACDFPDGSGINSDGGNTETHTYQKSPSYGGVRIQSVNTSELQCGSITSVYLCYEWWRTAAFNVQDCDLSVDSNGGVSYTSQSTTCPGSTANPGVQCVDVTGLESWNCDNFFGATGTRALAKSELTRVTAGAVSTETATWDVFYFNVTYTNNVEPTINNISLSKYFIKGGTQMMVYANTTSNGVNDTNANSLTLYCSNTTSSPTVADNICSGTDAIYPYDLTCSYNVALLNQNETVFCRVYDGITYSTNSSNATYSVDSTAPSLSIISVAGDGTPGYFDTVNDGVTSINISGESGMNCRWSSSDVAYSSMSSACVIDGIYAICNFTDVATQGAATRYISCVDSLLNENNATNNLDVSFTLDYTAPTTYDNSVTSFQVSPYVVTIAELDNVDGDPTTYYCTDLIGTCTPTIPIDNGGIVTFTTRGRNYLRYYSVDDAGRTQATQNKSININQLPNMTSAIDNATTIKGGSVVNVSTISYDSDSGQGVNLFVCSTPSATSAGCSSTQYCTATGTANLSCAFSSETDSATHSWYAFIYDDLGEAASTNPLSGSYTTDLTGPIITIISPTNTTYSNGNVTAEISASESSVWAGYSLDGATNNVSMTNISSTSFVASLTNLAYGLHNITFYANDSFGNYGVSLVRYFSIATPVDVTAPSLTIISPSNASYTNPSGTYINVSSDEDLVSAVYSLNGGNLDNLTNISAKLWYVNLTSLNQETNYTVVVYANDSSGNQGSRSVIFYADSLAPRYSFVSASPSSVNVSQPSGVNCSVYWNDTFSISSVIIEENALGSYENHTISFSGNSGMASYLIVAAKLINPGDYTCRFYATDVAGNSNSTSVNFLVNDVTAPTIIATSPTNGGIYNQENVLFSLVSNENLSLAWYSVNGSANVSMGNTSKTNWNASFSGTNAQSYSIVFYANDSSGNVGISDVTIFSINTGLTDSIPPVISIDSILNASYKGLSGVALNVTVNENVSAVWYSLNGSANVSLTNTSMFNWNANLSNLAQESTNSLVVYANDSAGNNGSKSITFYADSLAPRFINVSVTPSPANETQNVVCGAYVNDSFEFSQVRISENATSSGNFINHTIDLTSSGYANYTILNVARGGYQCVFYVTDAAGNSNSNSTTFSVNDVTAPAITINSPINQSYSTSSILFSITANENLSSARYSLDGGTINVSMTGSGLSWSKIVNVSDGSYTVVFYANDSSGNNGSSSVVIAVDTSVNDLVAPIITVWSPVDGIYSLNETVLLNISSNENLAWAGYKNNSGSLNDLGNISLKNWNATVSFTEGTHVIEFYVNDTSTNKNQGNRNVTVYVDLNSPNVTSFSCDSQVNDSTDLNCDASFSDAVGLDYAILSYNFSGSFVNSSQIDLSGTTDDLNYNFLQGNYTPGNYAVQVYLFDLAGRINGTEIDYIEVLDDSYPIINSVVYSPSSSDALDPDVNVTINASVTEDYFISNVFVYYKNGSGSWSSVEMSNTTIIDYNVTIEFGAGNWTFYINATDAQGNTNVSQNYTLNVSYDVSQIVSTNISLIKSFTYAQRSSVNELGYIILNITSDTNLNYNVTIFSDDLEISLFNLNNTANQTENYSAVNGSVLYLPVFVNLTDVTLGLYSYNISVVSEAGSELFEKYVNVQVSDGAYLSIEFGDYSSSVTRGQTDVDYSIVVTNLGTQDASGSYLYFELPSGFSLSSGSLVRNIGSLPVGVSATNSIEIDVSSFISSNSVLIYGYANSSNVDSTNVSRNVTINDPLVVTQTVTTSGGGGSTASGGGGSVNVSYSKKIDLVRGVENSFDIFVYGKYPNKTLENLKLELTGFPSQYIEISPSEIYSVGYGENKSFRVTLKAPSYKSYEEFAMRAKISGFLVQGESRTAYSEVQNIKLVIQEISAEKASETLKEAKDAIALMSESGFNFVKLNELLVLASSKLADGKNKEAYDLAKQIISTKELAFAVNERINKLKVSLIDPSESGNVADGTITGKAVFASNAIQNLLDMAISAFDRGDYGLADERAKNVETLLALERKGNMFLFLYLYWPYVILVLVLLITSVVIGYRVYQKRSVGEKIEDADNEEVRVKQLISNTQQKYFSGKMGVGAYHSAMKLYTDNLSKIREARLRLRSKRVKILSSEQVVHDLDREKGQTEREIMKVQGEFYKDKKIGEGEYKTQFEILNERLAEIEEERITTNLMNKKPDKTQAFVNKPSITPKMNYPEKSVSREFGIGNFFRSRRERKEKELKDKIDKLLREKGVKI